VETAGGTEVAYAVLSAEAQDFLRESILRGRPSDGRPRALLTTP